MRGRLGRAGHDRIKDEGKGAPRLRPVLWAITGVYVLRGVAGVLVAFTAPLSRSDAFWHWSSAICLAFGVVHAVGLRKSSATRIARDHG